MSLWKRIFGGKKPGPEKIAPHTLTPAAEAKAREQEKLALITLVNAVRPIKKKEIIPPTEKQLDREIRLRDTVIPPNGGKDLPMLIIEALHAQKVGEVKIPGDTLHWYSVTTKGSELSGGYYTLGNGILVFNDKNQVVHEIPGFAFQSTNDKGLPSHLKEHVNHAIGEFENFTDFVRLNPTLALNLAAFTHFRSYIFNLDGKRRVSEVSPLG